ncbi:MAG: hypothetical protein E6H66_20080 [Betaproteobacteria bacterium]|nr:MAG: hypothetical protein E6H66_20080 [Betaproteobacteria bacterium]
MNKVSFSELPFLVKAAVFVSLLNAWVLFEEVVIDRHGLWRYLPFYKVGLFCVWDLAALLLIGAGVFWWSSAPRKERASCAVRRSVGWCAGCT